MQEKISYYPFSSTNKKELTQGHNTLRTILDLIRWGASYFNAEHLFFGHGTDNAIDEAAALVLHALHLPSNLPPIYLNSRITKAERIAVLELLYKRITTRLPAAYLMQRTWFAGLEMYVDERVLVPRSPLAELIENNFQPWLDAQNIHTVLDIGTGSGCIGIAIAAHLPNVEVDLIDIAEAALEVAKLNVAKTGVEDRVQVLQSDLFQNLIGKSYDLIIANPPYVAASELANLPAEYQHEPVLGLAGGEDGLDLVRPILKHAHEYLEPHGTLIVEVGNSAATLAANYPQIPFTWLNFERGGDGVFLLTAEQLVQFHSLI